MRLSNILTCRKAEKNHTILCTEVKGKKIWKWIKIIFFIDVEFCKIKHASSSCLQNFNPALFLFIFLSRYCSLHFLLGKVLRAFLPYFNCIYSENLPLWWSCLLKKKKQGPCICTHSSRTYWLLIPLLIMCLEDALPVSISIVCKQSWPEQ